MGFKDYYKILGVSPDSSDDEIKKAYRRLAMKYHPDRNAGDAVAEDRFKEAGEAYSTLSDPAKRKEYLTRYRFERLRNRVGNATSWGRTSTPGSGRAGTWRPGGGSTTNSTSSSSSANPWGRSSTGATGNTGYRPGGSGRKGSGTGNGSGEADGSWNMEEIWGQGDYKKSRPASEKNPDEGLGDILVDLFRKVSGKDRKRGQDLRYEVELTFKEAILGVEKQLQIPRKKPCEECSGSGGASSDSVMACPGCHGTGEVRLGHGFLSVGKVCNGCNGSGRLITKQCSRCGGKGFVTTEHHLTVRIPPAVEEEQRLKVAGKGEMGTGGGESGDLYVVIRIKPHALLKREGEHLICEVPVTFGQAALGARLQVPTVDGVVTVKLPPGTQTGSTLRIKEKGVPGPREAMPRGDLLIRILVETPSNVSGRLKETLENMEDPGSLDEYPARKEYLNNLKRLQE